VASTTRTDPTGPRSEIVEDVDAIDDVHRRAGLRGRLR
jgi:hypothetical protein